MRPANLHRSGLAALLVAVAVASLRVILADNQPLWADPTTNMVPSVMLRDLVLGVPDVSWARWLSATGERLWLSSAIHLPFLLVIQEPLQAVRVAELCLHLGVIWGVYAIGCRLATRTAGLLAAYLLAAVPLMLSWGRAGNADPVIWATLLGLFWVLLRLDLRRMDHAIHLGLAAGLVASSRLIAYVYLSAAALWVLAFAVRSRRAALNLVPAALLSMIIPGWWIVARLDAVSEAARRSTDRVSDLVLQVLHTYIANGPGVAAALGLVALLLLWRRKLLLGRQLSLAAFWIVLPVLQLVFMWDSWERYLLPLLPQCALLVAVAAVGLSASWPAGRRRGLLAAVVIAGGIHMALTVAGLDSVSGLHNPDTRPYRGLARTLGGVPPRAPVLVIHSVFDDQVAFCLNLRQPPRDRRRLYSMPIKDGVWSLPPRVRVRHLLRVQVDRELGRKWEQFPKLGIALFDPATLPHEDSFPAFTKDRIGKMKQLARHMDPNGLIWTLYQVSPPITAWAAP